jgi:3D (Asp-Asp-Asp) domain-containing protein|tara:strand:- start:126 stop:638 length:513 start_codon:yes stop_codon:yes gene_type:complete
MNKHLFGLFVLLILVSNIEISTKIIDRNANNYLDEISKLEITIDELEDELNEYKSGGMSVTVTMYQPVRHQTDSTPNILADGTRIRTQDASNYKFIAVSRNLLKRFGGWLDYGDFIFLRGTPHKDGVYQVRDTMHSRWVNRIDILESTDVEPYKFEDAQIFKTQLISESE